MDRPKSFELYTLLHLEGRLTRLWRRNFLDPRRNRDVQVFYLPLVPLYRLDLDLHFKGPDNLNDLLLSLTTGGELSPEDLGPLFEQQKDGFYAPRLAGHVDDLTALDPAALRPLVRVLPRPARALSRKTRGLIDCDGLNWEQIMTSRPSPTPSSSIRCRPFSRARPRPAPRKSFGGDPALPAPDPSQTGRVRRRKPAVPRITASANVTERLLKEYRGLISAQSRLKAISATSAATRAAA